jgi:signal peptidase I
LDNFHTEPVQEPVTAEAERKGLRTGGCVGFLVDTIETVLLALILFLIINAVSARVRVENISMQPTLYQGEFVLVNKIAYKVGQAHHGDIIVFHYPRNPKEDYIKRLIGLPGDEVKIDNGKVYVNGTGLEEPYIAAPPAYNGTWTVPAGSFFVLGDNRNQSSDSHVWGYVSTDLVVGKALVVYWPLENLQILAHPDIVNAAQ